MKIEERISGLELLGKYLKEYIDLQTGEMTSHSTETTVFSILENAVSKAETENPWFTRENILAALENISISLEGSKIEIFTQPYIRSIETLKTPETIGVVIAGNIPLVGFHDFFCVLLAGHRFLGKLSSEDSILLPAIADILFLINPEFRDLISFSGEKFAGFDAIIATGSNNTHRYFEYYFGKYPHILRKNRNGVAILTGRETADELSGLADDIFLFFGRGCRSVSKLYLPNGFTFKTLVKSFSMYQHFSNHNKFKNNYDYYKAVYIIDRIPVIDFGHLLMIENPDLASPVSVIYYEYYQDISRIREKLIDMEDQIQCIVCCDQKIPGPIRPGNAQHPELQDYADGIDTMEFLLNYQLMK